MTFFKNNMSIIAKRNNGIKVIIKGNLIPVPKPMVKPPNRI